MELGLRGKVALVTGASKGLGRAIAGELAQEGMPVSICGGGRAELEKTADELRRHNVAVVSRVAGVTRLESAVRPQAERVSAASRWKAEARRP